MQMHIIAIFHISLSSTQTIHKIHRHREISVFQSRIHITRNIFCSSCFLFNSQSLRCTCHETKCYEHNKTYLFHIVPPYMYYTSSLFPPQNVILAKETELTAKIQNKKNIPNSFNRNHYA